VTIGSFECPHLACLPPPDAARPIVRSGAARALRGGGGGGDGPGACCRSCGRLQGARGPWQRLSHSHCVLLRAGESRVLWGRRRQGGGLLIG
jgi:hypothetical protein